ncbi:MAG: hypothetical protein ACH346_02805 [Chthoniobacterales bacterium]
MAIHLYSALLTAFGLGFLYFISAIPAAVVTGAPLWAATCIAWLGYCTGAATILLLVPLRLWLIKKFNISPIVDEKKLFWRIWVRYGVIGLGLIAPITIGPQIATLILLALSITPLRILICVSLGAIPSSLGLALVVKTGMHFL